MLTAYVQSYHVCLEELKGIYPQHWAELAVDKDIQLAPNYEAYDRLYAADALVLVTLRDVHRLVGYFLGVIIPELHYTGCKTCMTDIFYVLPEYRGGAGLMTSGLRLFKEAERELRRQRVQRWYANSKLHRDSGALFRRLGFTPVEMSYCKRLDK